MTAIAEQNLPRLRKEPTIDKLGNVDWPLVLLSLVVTVFGIVAIYSATRGPDGDTFFVLKQSLFLVVGLVAMSFVASLDYRVFRQFLPALSFVSVLALVLVLIVGADIKGTKGWFILGPLSLQPAEFAKLSLIVVISAMFTGRTGSIEAPRIMAALGVLGGTAVLVLLEGETGSVLVYSFIALGIFFAAGVPARMVLLLVASGVISFTLIFSMGLLKDYQEARLTAFIDVEADAQGAGYNQKQSEAAVGSGGVTGQGLFQGPQTQNGFVPEQQTDFIFTVIAEELGFVGAVSILALEALLLIRIFRIAQLARDSFGTLLCVGVFSMFLLQIFQNVGMTLRLMPITGITLPFVSYGGSSLLTSLLALGMVQSVAIHRYRGIPD